MFFLCFFVQTSKKKHKKKHKNKAIRKSSTKNKSNIMFFLCSVYVLVYVLFVCFVSIICVRPYFYVFLCFFVQTSKKKTQKKNIKIRPYANHRQKTNQT